MADLGHGSAARIVGAGLLRFMPGEDSFAANARG
jgi:hypothetical protein